MITNIAGFVTALTLAAGAASAAPVYVGFSGLATFTGPSYVIDDLTVTGSDDVHNLYLNGLGIVDSAVNNGEWVTFTFAQPVENVSVAVNLASTGSGQVTPGARTVEAFDASGNSLGSAQQSLTGDFDISAIAGGILSYFTMTAAPMGSFRIQSITYEVAPIPLPAAAPLLLVAIGGLAVARSRASRRA